MSMPPGLAGAHISTRPSPPPVTTRLSASGSQHEVSPRLLARYGYPPDAQLVAIGLVIRQMATFADEWLPLSG